MKLPANAKTEPISTNKLRRQTVHNIHRLGLHNSCGILLFLYLYCTLEYKLVLLTVLQFYNQCLRLS
jgi:hypothetical protein